MTLVASSLLAFAFTSAVLYGQASPQIFVPNDLEISAKIVLEDGSSIASSAMISLLVPESRETCTGKQSFMDGTIRLLVPPIFIQGTRQTGCYISVQLSGYRPFTGYVQEGTVIKLQRVGLNEGSSISIASLNAPLAAKKAYEAGEAAASRRKWTVAENRFRGAIQLYPHYAIAWSELGQVLQEQNRMDEAAEAFAKARQADPLYIKPIVQQAAVSGLKQHWEDELRYSKEALDLHAIEFPAAYYYHAEAAFQMGNWEDAERFTREALRLDPGGTCLESLVLLGMIFEKQSNPHDAAIEYRNYLEIAPNGSKSADARNSLARLKN